MDEKIPPEDKSGDKPGDGPADEDLPFSDADENFPEDEFPIDNFDTEKAEDALDEPPHQGPPDPMPSTHSHGPISDGSLDKINLSSVPIRIDLELARIKISLSELQKMQPGQKLPVNINPRIVNLVIDNKTIGRGEVVEVGDAMCIKILELFT